MDLTNLMRRLMASSEVSPNDGGGRKTKGPNYLLFVIGIGGFVLASMVMAGSGSKKPTTRPAPVAAAPAKPSTPPPPQTLNPLQRRVAAALGLSQNPGVGEVYNACEVLDGLVRTGCREDAASILHRDPVAFLAKLRLKPAEVGGMSFEQITRRCVEAGAWNVGALAHADDYCARGVTLAASVATGGTSTASWPGQLTDVAGGAFRNFVLGAAGNLRPERR